jgi:hypothetical protein
MTDTIARGNSGFFYITFISLFLAGGWMLWNTKTVELPDMNGVIHAENHGETSIIIECLEKSNLELKWKTKDGKWFLPCQLPDGKWGMKITDKNGETITSFIKGNGSWIEFLKYMIRQGASKYNGPIPW